MSWLAIAAATVAVLIVAALATPLHLDVRIELAVLRGDVRLRWLGGLINVTRSAGGSATAEPTRRKRAVPTAERRTVSRPSRRANVVAVLRTRGLLQRVVRFADEMLHLIRVQHLVLRARFGFDDPADTGQACGILLPAFAAASHQGVTIECIPDFDRAVLDGTCEGTISVTPLKVVVTILVFLGSPPVWRAIRAWRRTS